VIGERTIPQLTAFIDSGAEPRARALALGALQDSRAARALDTALHALDDPEPDVVIAALAVLREWVAREDGTSALEAVTAIAVDVARDGRVRAAAVEALSELPEHLVRPLRDRAPRPEGAWPSIDDPEAARAWIDAHGATAEPATVHALIDRLRGQEQNESAAQRRLVWQRARGLAHRALAKRGSRLALFDLRETFDTTPKPLPEDFLMAVEALGDASCLEPLARAWAVAPYDPTWRARVSTTAAAIAKRARLTARSAAMKRIRSQWPGFI
jgi:HEAT repeat protein